MIKVIPVQIKDGNGVVISIEYEIRDGDIVLGIEFDEKLANLRKQNYELKVDDKTTIDSSIPEQI